MPTRLSRLDGKEMTLDSGILFDKRHHEFIATDGEDGINLSAIQRPLSVVVQVTRRCPLACGFCSESKQFPDPPFEALASVAARLKGVQRVYLSGGEPLIRADIYDLVHLYAERFPVVGLPTNCVFITRQVAERLRGVISYINAGLDGPPSVNDRIRGGYDQIIQGLINLRDSGIEVSLSSVILRETLPHLHYVLAVADALGVTKVKFVIPVRRGRASSLKPEDFAVESKIADTFKKLVELKRDLGWRPRIKFAFWDANTEGYALLVFPDQTVNAWPVLDAPECAVQVGDLSRETIEEVWDRYPYKRNHVRKYTGLSMFKA